MTARKSSILLFRSLTTTTTTSFQHLSTKTLITNPQISSPATSIHHPSQLKPFSRFLCSSPLEKEMPAQSTLNLSEKEEPSSPPPFSSSAPIPFWSKEYRLPSSPSLFDKQKPSSSFRSNNSSSPFYTKKQKKPASKSPLSRTKKDKAPSFWPQKKKASAASSAAPPPPQKPSSPVTIAIKTKTFG
ncbi:hypothetical protein C5167_040108 [Papaver somniferum]|uniref:Uncharacterized protein n=1 Tax=Papaver somniferum TaxID=3469 RepID=A0A4Y7IHE9_PAPSO|nr:early nodulin-20-like [Papaver somniferum]RZC47170.1 hypothetical protein C5167_040108 [Papaver somniferum]